MEKPRLRGMITQPNSVLPSSPHHVPPLAFSRVARCIARADSRVLVALVMGVGLFAWVAPWQALVPCVLLAVLCMLTAAVHLPAGRSLLVAYIIFALFWSGAFFLLRLWEAGVQAEQILSAAVPPALLAVDLGARLLTLLGLAMIVPLNATPVVLGRVLNWYLWRVLRIVYFWRCKQPSVWRPGLALALMMSLLPRAWRALRAVKSTMNRRAAHLPLQKRLLLMCLAALRILGTQTWSVSLSIASRNLYRKEPWIIK